MRRRRLAAIHKVFFRSTVGISGRCQDLRDTKRDMVASTFRIVCFFVMSFATLLQSFSFYTKGCLRAGLGKESVRELELTYK